MYIKGKISAPTPKMLRCSNLITSCHQSTSTQALDMSHMSNP